MLISSGAKRMERYRSMTRWHPAFAWLPVKTEIGDWVWLERVLRKCTTITDARGKDFRLVAYRRIK